VKKIQKPHKSINVKRDILPGVWVLIVIVTIFILIGIISFGIKRHLMNKTILEYYTDEYRTYNGKQGYVDYSDVVMTTDTPGYKYIPEINTKNLVLCVCCKSYKSVTYDESGNVVDSFDNMAWHYYYWELDGFKWKLYKTVSPP
jgi:hypothetical protein